jgi:hypothetical protein
MAHIRRWTNDIDLTVMTGRELTTIRAVNAHQTQRARRRAIRQFFRAIVPMFRFRTR